MIKLITEYVILINIIVEFRDAHVIFENEAEGDRVNRETMAAIELTRCSLTPEFSEVSKVTYFLYFSKINFRNFQTIVFFIALCREMVSS